MSGSASRRWPCLALVLLFLLSCADAPRLAVYDERPGSTERPEVATKGVEVVLFALGLIDTGYRFGGKNPEAGLDCSGMVSYIYRQAGGIQLAGSAAELSRRGRAVGRDRLRPGDLVFFNTRNRAFSHVGLYIGDDRFVHAPSNAGRVRIDSLRAGYYAQRFEAARTFFD